MTAADATSPAPPTVTLDRLLRDLSRPEAYTHEFEKFEIHQTHCSVVFLVGEHVYKIKKPVNLGYLDYSTLELRKHFCEEEVRLNRRLALSVYHGVLPVVQSGDRLKIGTPDEGPAVEYAVHMRRLPSDRTLLSLQERGDLDPDWLVRLATRIAQFYRDSPEPPGAADLGGWETVQTNALENVRQIEAFVGKTLSPEVFKRLKTATLDGLKNIHPLITERVTAGRIRDTHGDLHLDHVYVFPDASPPDDLVIVDCIEFNQRFRYSDPMAEIAFVVMDLKFRGRSDLAEGFLNACLREMDDEEGRPLVPFFSAYRAVVRGKVESQQLNEKEIPARERRSALYRARAHFLLALAELSRAGDRPCLVLLGGLPATGKSSLARAMESTLGFTRFSSDQVRKRLSGVSPSQDMSAKPGKGIYQASSSDRTYGKLFHEARRALLRGERIVIDAGFRQRDRRAPFVELARTCAVPFLFVHCHADRDVIRQRIDSGNRDASDADWEIYKHLEREWDEPDDLPRDESVAIDTSQSPETSFAGLRVALETRELA